MSIVRILRTSRSRNRSIDRGHRALARAVASAPTRASRDELLSLAARDR